MPNKIAPTIVYFIFKLDLQYALYLAIFLFKSFQNQLDFFPVTGYVSVQELLLATD